MNIKRLTYAVALGAAIGLSPLAQGATEVITIERWATDTAPQYNGRIPRTVYLDEMGRRWDADGNRVVSRDIYVNDWRSRWDAADPDGRGLTPADVSRLTGNVDSSTSGMPISGAGAQPGNMGPANSKGQ